MSKVPPAGDDRPALPGRTAVLPVEPGSASEAARRLAAIALAPDQPGASVGPYRLLRLLGAGGMGAVWLADRQDGQFSKQVALKLLHPGMADPELRARFLQERQILASLQHPNIAALFDGGVSVDGRPYFAMEYVDGRAITHYCDAERLDVRDRVRLFLQVLRAVSHAHQRLIVHRDLKPSNVMVNAERVVKLLDFGIAKLLQAPGQAVVTQFGERAMTPRYAAPEQVRGEPVTVATDVYALGVTLFELLTGRTPYLGGDTRTSMEQAILTVEPCRPAQTLALEIDTAELDPVRERFERDIDKGRLRRELAGDLELIVLKALRKEPGERYASAEALAADLERYLDGRPVLARAPTLRYRAGKWLRRHAVAASSGTLAVLLLVGGLITVSEQRNRAAATAARAEATQDFLIGLFEEAGPDRGGSVNASVREILARGAARAERSLDGQDGLQRHLSALIGRLMNDVGDYDRAEPVLRSALAAFANRPADDPERLEVQIQLASTLIRLGRFEESETLWLAVLEHAPAGSSQRAEAHSGLGMLYARTNRFEDARRQHAAAIALWRAAGAEQATRLAQALVRSAYSLDYEDRSAAAAEQLREAAAILRAQPVVPQVLLGRTVNQLGVTQRSLGELPQARASLQEAAQLLSASLGRDHADAIFARRLLGDVMDEMGDVDASYALLQEVFDDAVRRYGEDSLVAAEVANSLATIDQVRGRYAAAERGFRIAVQALTAEYGEQHSETAVAWANLSNALLEQGRFEESIQAIRRSLAASSDSVGEASSGYALSLFALGRIQQISGDLDGAKENTEAATGLLLDLLGEHHSRVLQARLALVSLALDRGEDPRAALEAIDAIEPHVELDSRRGRRLRISILRERARAMAALGETAAAEGLLQEALAISSSEFPQGNRMLEVVALELAAAQLALGKTRAARASFARAQAGNPLGQPLAPPSQALRESLARQFETSR
jgi:eukaryotic-like serine/threonine-protein kinase